MARARLTLEDARHLDFLPLSESAYGLLKPYEAPEMETPIQLEARIGKTLDELPDIYGWFLQLHAWFDHWAEYYMNTNGPKDLTYKDHRVKRDLFADCASAAKLRYEGTSRRLTQISSHDDESRMPRGRRG